MQPRPGEQRRIESLQQTIALLKDLVQRLSACGWEHRRIHLFGFSQGGTTAIELLRSHHGMSERLGG